MAVDESALSELLAALRAGEGTDQVRTIAEWALQQLIELEATERNGHRPRVVSTLTGDLHLGIGPRSRESPQTCSLKFPTLWTHPPTGWGSSRS
jgi:hypothetical protein